ncbi:MAG: radical SAM protein [Planctomycetota bacterium]
MPDHQPDVPEGGEPEFRDALPQGPAHRRGAGLNPGNRFEAHRVHVLGEALDHQQAERDAEAAEAPRAGPSDRRSSVIPATPKKASFPDTGSTLDPQTVSPDTATSPGTSKHPPKGLPKQTPGRAPRGVALQVLADRTQTIINRVQPTSDVPFDWTVNPYRGCEHGCIYCFARPYHEYLGFSMGLDFETKIMAKHEAPDLLRRELAHRHWPGDPIVMSAITDIYQPVEKKLRIARGCLEVMAECFQPVSTMTKNTLVLRDLDLWQRLGEVGAGRVTVTLVTLDDELATRLEPRASPPSARLRIIQKLTEAGVPVSVNIAPVIPGLTDAEVPRLLEAVADAGARRVAWVLLRLPHQLKDLFLDWLGRNVHPDRARRVESLIRQARGGKLYDTGPLAKRAGPHDHAAKAGADDPRCNGGVTLGTRSRRSLSPPRGGHDRRRGSGVHVENLKTVFEVYCRKYGLNRDVQPIVCKHFRRPNLDGQMGLFG